MCALGLNPQSNGPLCRNNSDWYTVWAVTFGTARRGLGGLRPHPVSSSRCTKCNSPPINGQCTNFVLHNVALLPFND